MGSQRCSVVVLPAEGGERDRTLASIAEAIRYGTGDFTEFIPVLTARDEPREALAQAGATAAREGSDWLLAVTAMETVEPDIFVKLAPALRLHDAVWGGAGVGLDRDSPPKVEPITRLAAQDLAIFFHAALRWWIGQSHFVRPAAALEAIDASSGPAWYADYLIALWKGRRSYKTAQPLTRFAGTIPPLPETDRQRLLDSLAAAPVFMPVSFDAHTFQLPYTGLNPLLEREQARGFFFEHEELRFLAQRLPRGLRIADLGANTGNHTIFFAGVLAAERVTPVEPDPRAGAAIRAAVAMNGLDNVDLSCLGQAVGAGRGRMRPMFSQGGGLGATRFVTDPDGGTNVVPLDDLIIGPLDLIKIDVEGMEMPVLAGAEGVISRSRPTIYIEVLDETVGPFLAWADAREYRFEKLFPDKAHCNYFLVPAEHSSKGRR